jgi:Zn-dependent peptidase ImmA (M78 family)
LLFHTSGIDTLEDEYISRLPRDERRIEVICNRLAARLLVPEAVFERVFSGQPATEATAEELARLFKVSREFIFRKFLDRDLISQADYERAAQRWAARQKPGSGGDYYRTKMAYPGADYVRLGLHPILSESDR